MKDQYGFPIPGETQKTIDNLRDYVFAKKNKQEYSGPLTDEAKDIIAQCGDDLKKIEEEIWFLNFYENVLLG